MFFEIKLIITNFKMTFLVNSNGFWGQLREKVDFFCLINFDKKMNGLEDVIFFHDLLAVFLEGNKFIERDEIMVGLDEVIGVAEIFFNL